MSKKLIKPVYKKCGCGRRIVHHHILCDTCWKRKNKMKINKFELSDDVLK